MLIEFRVKNFRSLRDEQVLSLVASNDNTLEESHTVKTGLSAVPNLLRSAAVYGANAGGKSNVIKALQYMRNVVFESATVIQPGQSYNVQPFRLDATSVDKPTEFEVSFILDGVRYQYGFAMTSVRIVSEHLLVYKSFKPQRWFDRYYDANSGKDIYEFSDHLKGSKKVWEGATRPNALFLSMAVQLNSELLRPVFEWFVHKLVVINELAPLNAQISINMLKDTGHRQQICNILSAADIGIADIEVIPRKVPGQTFHFDFNTGKTEVRHEDVEDNQLIFSHVADQGNAKFELIDESSGTRNLLFLAGPILDMLKKGITLVFDELDTSLHTLLVRELVRLFHTPDVNTGNAQLIFSTHDASLLDAPDLFRRDQIWLVEKDREQASELIPLSDFSPRKNEALEKGYLMGRYGGVPFLDRTLGLNN